MLSLHTLSDECVMHYDCLLNHHVSAREMSIHASAFALVSVAADPYTASAQLLGQSSTACGNAL